jgi:hypothetical protein
MFRTSRPRIARFPFTESRHLLGMPVADPGDWASQRFASMRSLTELSCALQDHGIEHGAVPIASALLGVSRKRNWGAGDLQALVAWLEEVAVEVLRADRSGSTFRGSCAALDDLDERLKANGILPDVRKVASSIIFIAIEHGWGSDPAHMLAWLQQLAVDLAK